MAEPSRGGLPPKGYWQGSASNPYANIPGDALEDEEPVTRRRPEPIPSPAPRLAAQHQPQAAAHAPVHQAAAPQRMRDAGTGGSANAAASPVHQAPAPQRTQVAPGAGPAKAPAHAAPVAREAVDEVPARSRTAIATPLPPRPNLRGASMAGTDRLARAEAARRSLDTDAYFLEESRQPRKGRAVAPAEVPRRSPFARHRLRFWRWFRTLPIVVMALFATASIVVSTGLFGVDRWLYPVEYNRSISQLADAYGVDPLLVSAIIRTESGWDPNAVSRMGAVGLMQLLPGTAADLAASGAVDATRYDPTNLLDPETNIAYGTAYLRDCLNSTADLDQAIAAYNAGIAAAQSWAQSGTPFEEAIQYPETTAYLERVKQNLDRYTTTYPEGIPEEEEPAQ